MKKMPIIFLILLLFTTLGAACASAPQVDESMSTPVVGFVSVTRLTQLQTISLRIAPDSASDIIGTVLPGDQGELLGVDATGRWVLVRIDDEKGWIPSNLVDITQNY